MDRTCERSARSHFIRGMNNRVGSADGGYAVVDKVLRLIDAPSTPDLERLCELLYLDVQPRPDATLTVYGATANPDIIKFLKESYAFGHKAIATLNASNLVEPIKSGSGKPTTRLFLATFGAAHGFDHYGQMVEYLRMNGIVPPASRGQ